MELSPNLKAQGVPGYENGFNFTLHPERLDNPEDWSGEYVFTCSMSDLFHKRCPDGFITDVFDVMHSEDSNVWQLLTKRPERYVQMEYLPWKENIWAGTSVGHTKSKHRLDKLRECDAEVCFVSFEPLIEDLEDLDLAGIDWAIIGGESGPVKPDQPEEGIRELDLGAVRDIIQQCREQNTAVFVKQLGQLWARAHETDHPHGGHPYDWPEDLQIREMPRLFTGQPEHDPWP